MTKSKNCNKQKNHRKEKDKSCKDEIVYLPCEDREIFPSYSYNFENFNISDFDTSFGADGTTSVSNGCLSVNSVPFKTEIAVGNDHPRWLGFLKKDFNLPSKGEVIFKQKISGQQYIPVNALPSAMIPRIRNIYEDIRLASYAMNLIDESTFMVFDFICSNEIIYAFYERLPFGRSASVQTKFGGKKLGTRALGNYASFSNAIPVARRAGGMTEFNILEIGVDSGKGIVNWYVDGLKVFTVDKIGYRLNDQYRMLDLGGQESIVEVKSLRVGFGTFTLLDMALPNNYSRQYVTQIGSETQIMASALVQLDNTSVYAELYQGLAGIERPLVEPDVTFAYLLGQKQPTGESVKTFGQGAALTICELEVFRKDC